MQENRNGPQSLLSYTMGRGIDLQAVHCSEAIQQVDS